MHTDLLRSADYWMVGLRASFAHCVMYALVAIVTFMIGSSIGLLVGAALADVGRGMEVRVSFRSIKASAYVFPARSYADHPSNACRRFVCRHQGDAEVDRLAAIHLLRSLGLVRPLHRNLHALLLTSVRVGLQTW